MGAFDEPPFLREGKPELAIASYSRVLRSAQPALLSYQNFGGIATGLSVAIEMPDGNALLNAFALYSWDLERGKKKPTTPLEQIVVPVIEVKNGRRHIFYRFPEFVLPEGVNRYSAKLRGKGKQDQYTLRQFFLRFTPICDTDFLTDITVAVWPDVEPGNVVLLRF